MESQLIDYRMFWRNMKEFIKNMEEDVLYKVYSQRKGTMFYCSKNNPLDAKKKKTREKARAKNKSIWK